MSKINNHNIERLSKTLSSNMHKNLFGSLVKLIEDKRLNVNRSETWRVIQAFVAVLRSNANFTYELRLTSGLESNAIREKKVQRIKDIMAWSSGYHKTEKQIERIKCTKLKLLGKDERKDLGKNLKNENNRKLCKIWKQAKIERWHKNECSNCKKLDYDARKCIEPLLKMEKNRNKYVIVIEDMSKIFYWHFK